MFDKAFSTSSYIGFLYKHFPFSDCFFVYHLKLEIFLFLFDLWLTYGKECKNIFNFFSLFCEKGYQWDHYLKELS